MNLWYINALDPELPRYFNTWCDCGWKGRQALGWCYVIGANCSIIDGEAVSIESKCPKCKKRSHHLLDLESISARLRWVIDHSSKLERGYEVFPCTCNPTPSCRQIDEIQIRRSIYGGTCFGRCHELIKLCCTVKCNGCYATGEIAYLEEYNYNDFIEEAWVRERKWA